MPRLTVRAEDRPEQVLLDESVAVCHIDDQAYSFYLLERLAWAIHDGVQAEAERAQKRAGRNRRMRETPRPEPIGPRVLQAVR